MRAKQKTKIRKATRYFYISIATILLVFSSSNFVQNLSKENIKNSKKEIYSYTNAFDYDYKINLIDNKYIDEDSLQMGEIYVTDLIDYINLNLNYQYTASKDSNIEYQYEIIGKLQAVYTKDGIEQKIWDKEETLLEKQTKKTNSNKINIKESLKLDLEKQNQLVKDFEQEMNMSLDATYTILLKIKTNTEISEKTVENQYASAITIDLAKKTTQIKGDNHKEDAEYITKEIQEEKTNNTFMISVDVILFVISLFMYRYIFKKTVTMNTVRNEYRRELNRILRLCQDKIVQVKDRIDMKQDNVIDVKDFGEIIKVSEELFKPILYWESKETEEAWFSVVSNQVTYRYILKK